jgi:hypothetical protein
MAQVKCKFNEKLRSDVKLIYPVTSPIGNTDVQRVISNTKLSTAERGAVFGRCAAFDVVRSTARGSAYCRTVPSSVTVQQLMSSPQRRAVLSTAERLRHRSLCSS